MMYQEIVMKVPVTPAVRAAVERLGERDFLRPAEAAQIMGTSPEQVRLECKDGRYAGAFPVEFHGNRIQIPTLPFLRNRGYVVGALREEGTA